MIVCYKGDSGIAAAPVDFNIAKVGEITSLSFLENIGFKD